MLKNIKAVIFDLDGTLIDSMGIWKSIDIAYFKEKNIKAVGATFSDYTDAYAGKIGRYDYETNIYGCGMGRYFTLEVSTTEAIPFAIENLQIQWSPCSIF